jgi:site-specific DNA-methyltransferase (adenine-specific)
MHELPSESVHLVITSPPYNVGKDYDNNYTLKEYFNLLNTIWKEVERVIVPGGRVCINIANLGRKPYIPLHSYIIQEMNKLNFLMRGEIIWDKSASAGSSTAWGSWKSASNPSLRDVHEYILIFSKDSFKRPKIEERENSISRDEFLEYTKSIWSFPTESAKRIGHPAPFPVELPYRCIQLYTYSNDVVLDPFMGSGQTALAAIKSKRNYIGYDINKDYVNLAEKRIKNYLREFEAPKLTDYLPS